MKYLLVLLTALIVSPLAGAQASFATSGKFDVGRYGAVGDGNTLDTVAIQKTIDAASSAGGGTVVFPPGTYLSSSVRLRSNVTLHLEKDATLLGSPVRTGYQKAHGYGLIVAEGQSNIGISGKGTIDGNGKRLNADTSRLVKEGVLEGSKTRPFVINLFRCKNVTIRDITIRDGAFWVQDYRECEDLLIENIIVRSNVEVNNDGLDITDCKRVVVRGWPVPRPAAAECVSISSILSSDIFTTGAAPKAARASRLPLWREISALRARDGTTCRSTWPFPAV